MTLASWRLAVIERIGLSDGADDAGRRESVTGPGAEEETEVVEEGGREAGGVRVCCGAVVGEEEAEGGWGGRWGDGGKVGVLGRHGAFEEGLGGEVAGEGGEEAVLGLDQLAVAL